MPPAGVTCVVLVGLYTAGATMLLAPAVAANPDADPQATPAGASTGTTDVEAIIVTARKKEETAQKVPVAITTFSQAQLDDAHIATPVDLARFVPSLSISSSFSSPAAAQFSLRGQQSSDILLTLSDPVGFYEDSVAIPHAAGTNLGLIDLARIEVLNGPQGTLYGRNTTGGAINIITRGADYAGVHGYMSGELGDFDDRKLTAAVNVPVIEGVLSVRLAGQTWTRDGYGKSVTTRQHIGDDHNDRFGRLSVRFDPTAHFSSTTKLEYNHADQHGFLNAFRVGTGSLASVPGPYNAAGLALGLGDIYDVGINVHQNSNVRSWHAVQDMTWTIASDLKLRSITGYHRLSYFQDIDSDGSLVNVIASNIGDRLRLSSPGIAGPYPYKEAPDQAYSTHSQELDLSARAFDRLEWLVGVFGSTEEASGGQPNTFLSGTKVTGVLLDKLNKSDWGVFTQNDVRLFDRVHVTLGGRYSAERSNARVASLTYDSTIATGFPFKCVIGPTAFAADVHDCTDIAGHEIAHGVSYLASFNFQLAATQLLYLKTSRGFRGGALQQRTPSANPAKPEFATDYEVGSKNGFFQRRIRFNIDYYHTRYVNKQEQASIVDPTFGITSVISNAAAARIDGLEAQGAVNPLYGLSLSGSVSYLRGRYADDPCPVLTSRATFQSNTAGLPCPVLGAAAGPPYTYQSVANGAGLAFPEIAPWQYTLGVRYEHRLGRGLATGQLDYTWMGKRALNALNDITFNTAPSTTKALLESVQAQNEAAYGLLNLRLDYTLPEQQITVGLFATNLTNEQYATHSLSLSVASFALVTAHVQAPRMWGVSLRKAFGNE